MDIMDDKHQQTTVPHCPSVYCRNRQKSPIQSLPFAVSEAPGDYPVMLCCPGCHDLPQMDDIVFAGVDGPDFRPSYVHMFRRNSPLASPPVRKQYVPRIFGFGICQESDVNTVNEDH
jgi:hypothetical protein